MIGVMVAKLGAHYYRPDFGPEQVKHMALDFIEDLSQYPVCEVEAAFAAYRRNPENRFFPTPGMIRGIIDAARADIARMSRISDKPLPADPRPTMWWAQPRQLWKAAWRESEVPAGEVIRDESGGALREPDRAFA